MSDLALWIWSSLVAGLNVLLADNHLLAVCKPAGLPVVPDSSGDSSLLDQAKAWVAEDKNKPGAVFLGVVHRLDRPVSGVVLFARTSKAASRLSAAWRDGLVEKTYQAMGLGDPPAEADDPVGESGLCEQWLLKDHERNLVRVVAEGTEGARLARTTWRVLAAKEGQVCFELAPQTGRSHQLRVACASLGCPLLGDLKYGAERPLPDKSIALHAQRLVFPHPVGGAEVEVTAPMPPTLVSSWFAGE